MKFNKILSTLAAGLMLVAAGACTDEVKYDPAPKFDGDEVYFNLDEIGQLDIETDATSVSFHLYRVDASAPLTIGLESSVTDPDGEPATDIFDVPTEVTFPAGETSIEVPVGITFSAVTAETPYSMFVKIAGEKQTPYGATEGNFTLLYGTKYVPWREYLAGEYASFQMAGLWSYLYDAPLYVRESTNMPALTQYRIEGPFSDLEYNYLMTVHSDIKVAVEGETEDCFLVTMETLRFVAEGFDPFGDGSIFAYLDGYTFIKGQVNPEYTPEQIMRLCTLNEIGIPYYKPSTGEIFLFLVAQKAQMIGQFSYYPSAGGWQHIQFPGFLTLGVYIFDGGVSIDGTGLEEKQFDIMKTADTYGMKYTLRHGNLTDAQIEAAENELLLDEESPVITNSEATVKFELTAGEYTLIVVGVNEAGEKTCDKVQHFTYAPSVDDGFDTIGYAAYTDGFMCSLDGDISPATWQVEVQQDRNNPAIYRLKNAYRQWAIDNGTPEMAMRGNYYVTINTENSTLVYITEGNLGLRNSVQEGAVYGYSVAAQMLAEGKTAAAIRLRKMNGTMKNNVISFPVNSLLVAYANELPDYQTANTKSSFKLDLNTLTPVASAPVRGRIVNPQEKSELINVANNNVMLR